MENILYALHYFSPDYQKRQGTAVHRQCGLATGRDRHRIQPSLALEQSWRRGAVSLCVRAVRPDSQIQLLVDRDERPNR